MRRHLRAARTNVRAKRAMPIVLATFSFTLLLLRVSPLAGTEPLARCEEAGRPKATFRGSERPSDGRSCGYGRRTNGGAVKEPDSGGPMLVSRREVVRQIGAPKLTDTSRPPTVSGRESEGFFFWSDGQESNLLRDALQASALPVSYRPIGAGRHGVPPGGTRRGCTPRDACLRRVMVPTGARRARASASSSRRAPPAPSRPACGGRRHSRPRGARGWGSS